MPPYIVVLQEEIESSSSPSLILIHKLLVLACYLKKLIFLLILFEVNLIARFYDEIGGEEIIFDLSSVQL